MDSIIRPSYFGGATDIYHCYAEEVNYYDVNSLYLKVIETSLSLLKIGLTPPSLLSIFIRNIPSKLAKLWI